MPVESQAPTAPPSSGRPDGRWPLALGLAALALGTIVAALYARAGLTLSHYDAKAHLVVARRIADSLTPGWMQIGAVWLPLPHLVSAIPVQWDYCYRTGAFGVGLSILSFAAAVYFVARIVLGATGSRLGALAAALALGLNPDMLYLQSTPMTEPLLLAFTTASVWLTIVALGPGARAGDVRRAGLALAAACLTRYEAWPMMVLVLALGGASLVRRGEGVRPAARRIGRLAAYPAAAILGFVVLSRATVGEWFVRSGFFVPENVAMHRPLRAAVSVWWGVHELTSYPVLVVGTLGLAVIAVRGLASPRRSDWLPILALAGAAALPWYAFVSGHPFRIRYMIPLIPAVAVGLGCLVGAARRTRWLAAALAFGALAAAPRPMRSDAPMVLEAQWDAANLAGRQAVSTYLRGHWDGQPIMASMGSLAHFMQELSRDGYRIRDFLHEGNGDVWLAAFEYPDPHAAWMLVEERAEGGDMLAARARERPRFLAGYDRVAEGGGVALYRRRAAGQPAG